MSRAARVAAAYFGLAAACIAYELSIRVFHRGSSEFAGMLSTLATLPSSLALFAVGRLLGVRPGDSDLAFVALLGLAAGANALVVRALAKRLG